MTASVRRRAPSSRAVLALGAVALLALLAVAALLLGGAFGDRGEGAATEAHHHTTITAASGHDHAATAVHALRQQPSTRARSLAFAVLATAAVLAAWAFQRLRFGRAGHPRALRIVGLPPGRAPPALRIV